jgi:hypothetical protein
MSRDLAVDGSIVQICLVGAVIGALSHADRRM